MTATKKPKTPAPAEEPAPPAVPDRHVLDRQARQTAAPAPLETVAHEAA